MSGMQETMISRGFAALKAGDVALAGQIAETAIARNPNDLAAMALLCRLHGDLRNYGTALVVSRLALQVARESGQLSADEWYNAAQSCKATYQKDPALEALDKAAELAPEDYQIHALYSSYWLTYGDPEKAAHHGKLAVDFNPESARSHVNYAMALLCLDRWEEAWPHFEWRKKIPNLWKWPETDLLWWDGGKVGTLVVRGEQGLGDEIFNLSVLPRLFDRADRVVIECSQRLVPLLRRSLGCEVYGSPEECNRNGVRYDGRKTAVTLDIGGEGRNDTAIVAAGSLPLFAGATRENSNDNAYLQADPARAIFWRAALMQLAQGRPIIGVAWRGGTYENHEVLRNPPRELFRRLDPQKYLLVSVQYGDGMSDIAREMGMLHFQQAIDDLDEQAALIKACDKVVTVAQTAMHIAGGLNVPTLALIGQYPKWDCGASGDAVPWWKSVKAIRQRDEDWPGVFDRLLAELGEKPDPKKVEKFGPLNLAHINIGGCDATPADIRAAQ